MIFFASELRLTENPRLKIFTAAAARLEQGALDRSDLEEKPLAKKKTLLERMVSNPAAGWTVDDLAKLCAEQGLEWSPPTRGSHYKAVSRHLAGHLTVPYNRPIKVIYVKRLCSMIVAHLAAREREAK